MVVLPPLANFKGHAKPSLSEPKKCSAQLQPLPNYLPGTDSQGVGRRGRNMGYQGKAFAKPIGNGTQMNPVSQFPYSRIPRQEKDLRKRSQRFPCIASEKDLPNSAKLPPRVFTLIVPGLHSARTGCAKASQGQYPNQASHALSSYLHRYAGKSKRMLKHFQARAWLQKTEVRIFEQLHGEYKPLTLPPEVDHPRSANTAKPIVCILNPWGMIHTELLAS